MSIYSLFLFKLVWIYDILLLIYSMLDTWLEWSHSISVRWAALYDKWVWLLDVITEWHACNQETYGAWIIGKEIDVMCYYFITSCLLHCIMHTLNIQIVINITIIQWDGCIWSQCLAEVGVAATGIFQSQHVPPHCIRGYTVWITPFHVPLFRII